MQLKRKTSVHQLPSDYSSLLCHAQVFGWGENTHGQLGTGTEEGPEVEPKEMKVPHRVVAISAGATHSAVLTDRGSVFTVGDGTWGQRGSQDDKSSPKPRQITCQVYD